MFGKTKAAKAAKAAQDLQDARARAGQLYMEAVGEAAEAAVSGDWELEHMADEEAEHYERRLRELG